MVRQPRRSVTNFSVNGVFEADLLKDFNKVSCRRSVDTFSFCVESIRLDGRSFSLFESTCFIVEFEFSLILDSYVDVTNEICSKSLVSFTSSLSSLMVFKLDAVDAVELIKIILKK